MKDNNWTYKPLSELCGINLGNTPSRSKSEFWGKGYPWVSISDLKEKVISKTKEEITEIALNESNCKLVKKGTLLMSFKLSIGKLAFAGKDLYTNEAIVALPIKDESELLKDYLYYVLKSIPLVGGNQAAMGQTLNKQSLSVLQIPLPPTIEDQKRIAKVLSKCETLIHKRVESIFLLNEQLRATFLQMFGDPISGLKYPRKSFKEVSTVRQGLQIPISERKKEPGDNRYPYITNQFINGGKIAEYIENPRPNVICNTEDVLMTRTGNTGIVLTDVQGVFHNNFFLIDFDRQQIQKKYLVNFLRLSSVKSLILKKASTTTIPDLNHGDFYKITLPVPPPEVQTEFALIADSVDSLKNQYKNSLNELENLYGSISQRVFKAELDLSKVDISDMEDSKKKDLEVVKEDITEEQLEDLIDSFEHTLPTGEVPSNRQTNIRNMSIRQYLCLPDNEETEVIEFSFMNKDFFYQFILIKGFPEGTFTLPDLEQYARKYILRGTGFEFTYENWKTIIFRFIGAKQPIIEQVFDEDDKTIKFKLTDEAFKV